ncbi:MAG: hypothetical protein ACO1SV_09925 [Fimbriimonas sp.]
MTKTFFLGLVIVSALSTGAPAQSEAQNPTLPPAEFEGRTERGWIRLRNFAKVNFAEDGTVSGTATGNPVVLEDTERGLTITGKAMTVRIRLNPKTRKYVLEEATVADGSRVLFDSEAAYKNAVEFKKTPAPKKPDAFQRTQLDSDAILYRVQGNEGLLTLPHPLTVVSDSRGDVVKTENGQTTRVPFTQHTQFQGSKGQFTVAVDPAGEDTELQTGRIEGPTTVRMTRTETVPNAPQPEVTNVNGKADLVELDFKQEKARLLTATGNVDFEGDGRGLAGRVRGTKAVITLDAQNNPTNYEFTGSSGAPTTTTVRFKDGGR